MTISCREHIYSESLLIESDIFCEDSKFLRYLQTKIRWYWSKYLCLFFDCQLLILRILTIFVPSLTHSLKSMGLRKELFQKKYILTIAKPEKVTIFAFPIKGIRTGAVVQSVRISACHAGGREFESRPHRSGERKWAIKLSSLLLIFL